MPLIFTLLRIRYRICKNKLIDNSANMTRNQLAQRVSYEQKIRLFPQIYIWEIAVNKVSGQIVYGLRFIVMPGYLLHSAYQERNKLNCCSA